MVLGRLVLVRQLSECALVPVAELDPNLLPWRNCSDLRVDVSVAHLLATVAIQEVMRVGGPA